jgi:hypothetical protein
VGALAVGSGGGLLVISTLLAMLARDTADEPARLWKLVNVSLFKRGKRTLGILNARRELKGDPCNFSPGTDGQSVGGDIARSLRARVIAADKVAQYADKQVAISAATLLVGVVLVTVCVAWVTASGSHAPKAQARVRQLRAPPAPPPRRPLLLRHRQPLGKPRERDARRIGEISSVESEASRRPCSRCSSTASPLRGKALRSHRQDLSSGLGGGPPRLPSAEALWL